MKKLDDAIKEYLKKIADTPYKQKLLLDNKIITEGEYYDSTKLNTARNS